MPPADPSCEQVQWLEDLRAVGGRADEAQRALREVLRRGLGRSLRSRGVDDSSLEDFVQEALLKILANLDDFRGDSQFTTWAMAIAIRVAFTELRRARWRDRSLDAMLDGGENAALARLFATPAEAEQQVQSRQVMTALERVIRDQLTPRQRKALLAELAGVPKSVLAERLETNTNALYKLTHDARRRLRDGLLGSGLTSSEIRAAFEA